MDLTVTPAMLLTVCPLVFLAAVVDAIGGGGGIISLPAYLVAGLPPHMAAGTNKFSASFGTLVATLRYLRGGKLVWKPSLCAVAGALPGAYLGAELLKRVPESFLKVFLMAAIPLVAVALLFYRGGDGEMKPLTAKRLALCCCVGLFCGVYDGFFGPGTGTLLIMGLMWFAGMDAVSASGSAKLVNLASNASALASLLVGGKVLYALALPAVACSLVGGWLGAQLALWRGAKLIRYVMFGVLALLVFKLVAEYFGWVSFS